MENQSSTTAVPSPSENELNNEQQQRIKELEEQIKSLKEENARLRRNNVDGQLQGLEDHEEVKVASLSDGGILPGTTANTLSRDQIERYSRQLLIHDGIGVEGQLKLLSSSVMVVGAGGIGSTVILYLAACGVGHITVVDFDQVEMSNLHRQVIHKSNGVGCYKAESACQAAKDLNPTVHCQPLLEPLTHLNAFELVSSHDCVIDASDNPRTRYLINDACVLAGKPLVSGSAMGVEGQLTVYNFKGGPCYRCLYPKPNTSEGQKTCADNGVLGPVPGLIGILQAVETIKIITGKGDTMHDRLIMYDSLRCSFMNIKKPPKIPNCIVCGPSPSITSMNDSYDAVKTTRGPGCSIGSCDSNSLYIPPPIPESLVISCADYNQVRTQQIPHVLVDVRVKEQFDLCALGGAINIPLSTLNDELDRIEELSNGTIPVYCICRRGVLSVSATKLLKEAAKTRNRIYSVKNIHGGLESWRMTIDRSFPTY